MWWTASTASSSWRRSGRRQINAYYAQLSEGLLEYVGPLVETRVQEKPLSIALREISEGLVSAEEAAEA